MPQASTARYSRYLLTWKVPGIRQARRKFALFTVIREKEVNWFLKRVKANKGGVKRIMRRDGGVKSMTASEQLI
jgi:hypothetical protein